MFDLMEKAVALLRQRFGVDVLQLPGQPKEPAPTQPPADKQPN